MPLVRLELRNEYALGVPELYRMASEEDPKGILEGVSVAGLVGVLRQIGDLAEFAAEVFHGLQEDVTTTTSRSHRLISRVKRLEAALSPLEKAVLVQRSHLHFAYTAGSSWHTHVRIEKNHFVYSDLPKFIMDSYEDCRGPPHLQLLDRFDPGGPGSCLKRYSDPSFFKRASAASDEASTPKVMKEKTGRKTKRRRPWPRSGDASKNASFSCSSDRMPNTQVNTGGNASLFQAVPACDAALNSGVGTKSKMGLENGSEYVEGMFFPVHSKEPEERDTRKHISSPMERQDTAFLDVSPIEEKITELDDDELMKLSLERIGCSSTFVGRDEKTETLDPRIQEESVIDGKTLEHDRRQSESFSGNMDLESVDDYIVDLQSLDKMDAKSSTELDGSVNFQTHDTTDRNTYNKTVLSWEHADDHVDDIENEIDQFVDALNTIESESEPESDWEKRSKVEHSLEEKEMDEVMRPNLECKSSTFESSMSLQTSAVNDEDRILPVSPMVNDEDEILPESPMVNAGDIFVCQVDEALQSSQTDGFQFHENGIINSDETIKSVACNLSGDREDDLEMQSNRGRSSPEAKECSEETSKASSVTFWTNGNLLGLQPSKPPDFKVPTGEVSPSMKHLTDEDEVRPSQEKLNNFDDEMDCSRWKTAWKLSPADLDIKLGNRLFGSKKNLSPFENDNGPSSLEHRNRLDVSRRAVPGKCKDLFDGDSPARSPCSSPPLQHMKVSFQPMEGPEVSKLKLKFPNGNTDGENGSDLFPSFQLIPEVSIRPEENAGSDSDADSFCGSSDNSHSSQVDPHSDWESNESPTSKERDLYDSLNRVSISESVSTAPENGRRIHRDIEDKCGLVFPTAEYSSFSVHDLDAIFGPDSGSKNLVHSQVDPTPAPPPLPPVQWRGDFEDKLQAMPTSTVSQPKPAPLNENRIDTTSTPKIKRSYSQNSACDRKAHEKNIDENDFLHQIRVKSFNLRRTATEKPTATSGASTNVQVNAILKKATAIRQAVASDGDEDGSWSEA